ncbi:MAG: MBL fold metallo-hydrolase [Rhizobiales bacterium]|nr:MBL fold metallo-hydrolase [Hyphomicrobiales bacterium]
MTTTDHVAIESFFDEPTNTVSYLVWDRGGGEGAVIDPVLDFDHRSGVASTRSADAILKTAETEGVAVKWVLETHAHADHLSAAPYVKLKTGAKVAIGEHIRDVQKIFRPVFNMKDSSADGTEFDRLLTDGERLRIGTLQAEVIYTPGHTPACVSYRIEDAVFVGDTLFMPDYGTARADFPGGDARTLYRSMQRLLTLPDETRLFMCHDYKAPGRDSFAWESTVAAERSNVNLAGRGEDEYVALREARDATLPTPLLLMPAIQTNIRAGKLPEAEANGVRYLKIPVTMEGVPDAAKLTQD